MRWPGLGLAAKAESSCSSSDCTSAAIVSGAGRAEPGGGIIPERSLAITFSATSDCAGAVPTSKADSERLPRLAVGL